MQKQMAGAESTTLAILTILPDGHERIEFDSGNSLTFDHPLTAAAISLPPPSAPQSPPAPPSTAPQPPHPPPPPASAAAAPRHSESDPNRPAAAAARTRNPRPAPPDCRRCPPSARRTGRGA